VKCTRSSFSLYESGQGSLQQELFSEKRVLHSGEDKPEMSGTGFAQSSRTQQEQHQREQTGMLQGLQLGNYQLMECLGVGGHAALYLARHIRLDTDSRFVVKVLDLSRADKAESERFLREAMLGSRIRHPHVVPIFDLQEERGYRYIVMEYIEGQSLDSFLRSRAGVTLQQICQLGTQIAEGMEALHQEGIVHRDLKPDNILVTSYKDEYKALVIDFGLAFHKGYSRLTPRTNLCGTPVYVAPELCQGHEPTPLCDVYSLGIMLYEMVSGHVPFEGDTIANILLRQIHDPPPPLPRRFPREAQKAIERLLSSMLSKNPQERPRSMNAVSYALRELERMSQAMTPASGKVQSENVRLQLQWDQAQEQLNRAQQAYQATSLEVWELQQRVEQLTLENRHLRTLLEKERAHVHGSGRHWKKGWNPAGN
jgi:serine/threonine protein kinase